MIIWHLPSVFYHICPLSMFDNGWVWNLYDRYAIANAWSLYIDIDKHRREWFRSHELVFCGMLNHTRPSSFGWFGICALVSVPARCATNDAPSFIIVIQWIATRLHQLLFYYYHKNEYILCSELKCPPHRYSGTVVLHDWTLFHIAEQFFIIHAQMWEYYRYILSIMNTCIYNLYIYEMNVYNERIVPST